MPRSPRTCIWEGCTAAADGYYCQRHAHLPESARRARNVSEPAPIPAFDAQRWFWPKVRRTDGCWTWTAGTDGSGYGKIRIAGRIYRASRVAYALTKGDPGDAMVLHRCDNRLCVNPAHLYLGDVAQNALDMRRRGRGANRHGAFGWSRK